MTDFFLALVRRSLSAGWLVLAVLLLRLFLRKAPKWTFPALWGLVGLRLILPFSIESPFSLLPSAERVPLSLPYTQQVQVFPGDTPAWEAMAEGVEKSPSIPIPAAGNGTAHMGLSVLSGLWLLGVAGMLIYALAGSFLLHRRLETAVPLRGRIYQSEYVNSPFVLGVLHPRIYLPFRISEPDASLIIAHEQAHIQRRDHWWKPLGFLLLSVYWFHPLLWVAYFIFCRDIELACDERVIRALDGERRADYSQALLGCSVLQKNISVCPLAFGETGVKERVKQILNYRKPAFWATGAAIAVCIAAAVCFLTDPAKADVPENTPANVPADVLEMDDLIQMVQEDKLQKVDFLSYTNSVRNESPHSLTYYLEFDLNWNGKALVMDVYLQKEGNALDSIYLRKKSNQETMILYSADSRRMSKGGLEDFLAYDEDIHNHIRYSIPSGLSETHYSVETGFAGGVLLQPDAYELYGEDSFCPDEWKAAGMVSMYYTDGLLQWEGDQITNVFCFYNHTNQTGLQPLDGLCAPAYLVQAYHDMYTVPEMSALEANGIQLDSIDTESAYWYVYFARPGDEIGYVISLNAKNYTMEDILSFAQSVQYLEEP